MSRTEKKIAALTKEIQQKNALLSDLAQKAKEEKRRADTRRKIIYGGAFFAYLASLTLEQRARVKAAIDGMITNKKDRQFLGISGQ